LHAMGNADVHCRYLPARDSLCDSMNRAGCLQQRSDRGQDAVRPIATLMLEHPVARGTT
jgi:hypothetical protein